VICLRTGSGLFTATMVTQWLPEIVLNGGWHIATPSDEPPCWCTSLICLGLIRQPKRRRRGSRIWTLTAQRLSSE
jgi:hypothetical protein